jgi:uncharacterized membrane protein
MNQLMVIGLDHVDDARSAMQKLRTLEREGLVRFEDTAIVERDTDGAIHVHNEVSGTTEMAAAIGAIIGGFLTFVFPPAGIAIGAALGAAVGTTFDTGVSPKFVDEVKAALQPGRSALFLVIKEAHADPVLAALRDFHGDVIQTTLDSETEEALRQTLV